MKHLKLPNSNRKPVFKDLPIGAVFSDNHRHFAIRYLKISNIYYIEDDDGEFFFADKEIRGDLYHSKYIENQPLYWKETYNIKE